MMAVAEQESVLVVECAEAPPDAETMLRACAVRVRHSEAALRARVRAGERIAELSAMDAREPRSRDSFPPRG